jgi:hypothetical protein
MIARISAILLDCASFLGEHPMLHTPIKRRGDMGYGLANIATFASDAASIAEPVAVTILDLLGAVLGSSLVDFVKADVEGHEGR